MLLSRSSSIRSSLAPVVRVASARYATAPTFDYRRLHKRSRWRNPDLEDADCVEFPREKLGRDYQLNWAINRYQVTPKKEAFRNLHLRGLQMMMDGYKDADSVVAYDTSAASHKNFIVQPETQEAVNIPAGWEAVGRDSSKYVVRDVRRYLSSVNSLFVHDGALGAGPSTVLSRTITNSAATALGLMNVQHNTPLGHVIQFPHDFVAIIADEITTADAAKYGLSSTGSDSFALFDTDKRTVVLGGNPSFPRIVEALAAMSSYVSAAAESAIPVPNSYSLKKKDGSSVLVIGAPTPSSNDQLFGAHSNNLVSNGVARLFDGVVAEHPSAKPAASDLVLSKDKKITAVVSKTPSDAEPICGGPTAVLFASPKASPKKGNTVLKVSAKDAAALFQELSASKIPVADAASITAKFSDQLSASKIATYMIDPKAAPADVLKAIGSA